MTTELLNTVRIWTAAELETTVFPPQSWAVDGLIGEGLTLLAGSPKVGKSWLALDIALAVASGGLALGAVPVEAATVLYLALEDTPRRLKSRLDALGVGQAWPAALHIVTDKPDNLRKWLPEYCLQHKPRLVIVDTLARVRPFTSSNVNAYEADYAFAGQLQSWASSAGVCLLAIHHDRKAQSADFVDNVSGTHGITGAADTILLLTRDRGEDAGLLQLTGRDVADERAWSLTRVGPAWHLVDQVPAGLAVATQNLGDRAADIVGFLARQSQPVNAAAVAIGLGIDDDTARRYLSRLADSDRIARVSRGLYWGVSQTSQVSLSLTDLETHRTDGTGVEGTDAA